MSFEQIKDNEHCVFCGNTNRKRLFTVATADPGALICSVCIAGFNKHVIEFLEREIKVEEVKGVTA